MREQTKELENVHIPYNIKLKERSRELRKTMTVPEKKLWYEFLKPHQSRFLR